MPDGSDALLMEPDVQTACQDAALAERDGAWRAERITQGRATILEGEALRAEIARYARIAAVQLS
jgi:hypothetical protein